MTHFEIFRIAVEQGVASRRQPPALMGTANLETVLEFAAEVARQTAAECGDVCDGGTWDTLEDLSGQIRAVGPQP
jgi:hypothetical protein